MFSSDPCVDDLTLVCATTERQKNFQEIGVGKRKIGLRCAFDGSIETLVTSYLLVTMERNPLQFTL